MCTCVQMDSTRNELGEDSVRTEQTQSADGGDVATSSLLVNFDTEGYATHTYCLSHKVMVQVKGCSLQAFAVR